MVTPLSAVAPDIAVNAGTPPTVAPMRNATVATVFAALVEAMEIKQWRR
jgi:hypothetical protein